MLDSERINNAFSIAKYRLNLSAEFVDINGGDTVSIGAHKIERNIEKLVNEVVDRNDLRTYIAAAIQQGGTYDQG